MKFKLSLRFREGSFDPNEISNLLETKPSQSSLEPDYPRKGCYWAKRLDAADDLLDALYGCTDWLWPKRNHLKALKESGITPSLFLSIQLDEGGNGFIVPPDVFARLATLGITLEVDLYSRREYTDARLG